MFQYLPDVVCDHHAEQLYVPQVSNQKEQKTDTMLEIIQHNEFSLIN